MYQARKKIVPGSTNALRLRTSSWNSGDCSMASQSISRSTLPLLRRSFHAASSLDGHP